MRTVLTAATFGWWETGFSVFFSFFLSKFFFSEHLYYFSHDRINQILFLKCKKLRSAGQRVAFCLQVPVLTLEGSVTTPPGMKCHSPGFSLTHGGGTGQ